MKVSVGRIREKPSTEAIIRSRLHRGEEVNVISDDGEWYQIRTDDGRFGWAHQSLFHGETDAMSSTKPGTIKVIRATGINMQEGKITIELDGYFLPQTSVITGERPRVVGDFYSVRPHPKLARSIKVEQGIIHAIRMGVHLKPHPKTRVVVDLSPYNNYVIDQSFSRPTNTYLLDIHF